MIQARDLFSDRLDAVKDLRVQSKYFGDLRTKSAKLTDQASAMLEQAKDFDSFNLKLKSDFAEAFQKKGAQNDVVWGDFSYELAGKLRD